jgi:hypothetical protein
MSEVVGGCGGLGVTACDAQGNEMISQSNIGKQWILIADFGTNLNTQKP